MGPGHQLGATRRLRLRQRLHTAVLKRLHPERSARCLQAFVKLLNPKAQEHGPSCTGRREPERMQCSGDVLQGISESDACRLEQPDAA